MKRSAPAIVCLALTCVVASSRRAWAQTDSWTTSPSNPTVGDTVWVSRRVSVPQGWRVRPGKLVPLEDVEPLGDATVALVENGWAVSYPVVVWEPGTHDVSLPPIWRFAPDGHTDSITGGMARLVVQSVIPDSLKHPEPRPALVPLRRGHEHPLPLVTGIALGGAIVAAAVMWRRRPARGLAPGLHVPLEPEVPDARWLAAGEAKAVATRAAGRLRAALAANATTQVSDTWSAEITQVLGQLERAEFSSASGTEIAALSTRARALA
ncbi:MAG TPA: hypothetical protein VLV45_08905, partial [Gemmatimonadales bacterium]|nr:hypothetical protein [Gemmatimonadales bacterium]